VAAKVGPVPARHNTMTTWVTLWTSILLHVSADKIGSNQRARF